MKKCREQHVSEYHIISHKDQHSHDIQDTMKPMEPISIAALMKARQNSRAVDDNSKEKKGFALQMPKLNFPLGNLSILE